MATPSKILLTVNDTGIVRNKEQTQETATRTSELLQENHDKHHVLFNAAGFHNHIAHDLLTLYGLGATTSQIEKRYNDNLSYQRPPSSSKTASIEDMTIPETFTKHLGKQQYYLSYLRFFQQQMEEKGWEKVLQDYIFAGDERADDLLGRMYAGFLHPIIHLGFGIEFNQPAMIAESLAEACIHDTWTKKLLLQAEEVAKSSPSSTSTTLVETLHSIRADRPLSTAAHWTDNNKISDGILVRAPSSMLKYATQWVVTTETLDAKTTEMINTSIYFTASAQRPPKQVKMDFYYMHCVNSSIFFPTFNNLSWLSVENKVRLLQWKGYLDLTMYASRRSPALLLDEIIGYMPVRSGKEAEWEGVFERLFDIEDDGHAVKLGRAVRNGQLMSDQAGNGEGGLMIKGNMWENIGNMVIDSVEDDGAKWGRGVGFDEAWEEYGNRKERSPQQT
ncbi:hypothetical protein BJ875DRAFT_371942 [Amylocarpus encephaloides]|uniref:HypA protein n=1 Tax=Amylocarpus encephaloides TaxID=45428 RepID=A0A9P7YMZ4_9HELO|nr:hypothetical protein BJ875DRAFT_371942 [Amylocarpus encephaloides]